MLGSRIISAHRKISRDPGNHDDVLNLKSTTQLGRHRLKFDEHLTYIDSGTDMLTCGRRGTGDSVSAERCMISDK